MEELRELAKEGDYLTKKTSKNPKLVKLTGLAAVPASAIIGMALSPSGVVASAVGTAITGVAGFIGKDRLDAATELAARPALARVIVDTESGGTITEDVSGLAAQIDDLQRNFGVDDEDFRELKIDIYRRYLVGMVKMPVTQTGEMKELKRLRDSLTLNNLAVAEAHASAANAFYRETSLYTPAEELEDPDHPDRISIDKFLFLSERVFRMGGETDEAFNYEMGRVSKAFALKNVAEARERVSSVALPFYKKALQSTVDKLAGGKVNADLLKRARATLGIDELVAADMHMEVYSAELRSLLGKQNVDEDEEDDEEEGEAVDEATLSFKSGDRDRLAKLQEVLGIADRETDYELYSETTPLFHARACTSMEGAIAGTITPQKAWKEIKVRQGDLLLKDSAMKDLLVSIVSMAMGKPLEEAMEFAKVNNEAATYDKLMDALQAKGVAIQVLKESGWEGFDDFNDKFCNPQTQGSSCAFLSGTERSRLYRIMLNRAVRQSESGKELTDELYEKVQEVQGLLGIDDDEVNRELSNSFGPELQKTLETAMLEIMGDDYTPELLANLKKMKDEVISSYRISESIVQSFAGPIYSRAVAIVNQKTPSGIPSSELMIQLVALRELLDMSEDSTYETHLTVFGGEYRKGILEAMGSTGIIRPEFRGPLEDLRGRLGVSEESGRDLFIEACQERMVPMVEWVVLELERTMLTAEQLAKKRQKDFGEDYFKTGKGASGTLGLGSEANIMTDCMNLIDFYRENDIKEQQDNGKTKTIEKRVNEDGEEKTINEEVPDLETVYPITALKTNAIQDEQIAELLYRQFVVGGFTTKDQAQAARYEEARADFGGIIGLDQEKMEEITDSIGSQVYENFIGNAMRTKGSLDQQDMMFLANIQSKLGLDEESSEKMLTDTQKKILSEEASALLDNIDDVGPDSIKAFREKCNVMGMDLEQDIGISKPSLTRMFEAEVGPGLTAGEITVESGGVLSEIQESLGLTPDEATEMFEDILNKRVKSAISRIKSEILRGREESCVEVIERIVRYAQFVNGEFSDLDVDESTAWSTFNLYDKMAFDGVDPEIVEDNKSLLKMALGL